jgi:hypothetical protein
MAAAYTNACTSNPLPCTSSTRSIYHRKQLVHGAATADVFVTTRWPKKQTFIRILPACAKSYRSVVAKSPKSALLLDFVAYQMHDQQPIVAGPKPWTIAKQKERFSTNVSPSMFVFPNMATLPADPTVNPTQDPFLHTFTATWTTWRRNEQAKASLSWKGRKESTVRQQANPLPIPNLIYFSLSFSLSLSLSSFTAHCFKQIAADRFSCCCMEVCM